MDPRDDLNSESFSFSELNQQNRQRHRRGAIMVSSENLLSDTELSAHEGSLKAFKAKSCRKSGGIFSNPFKSDKEKMEQLTELLNQYSQIGIPEQAGLLTFKNSSGNNTDSATSSNTIDCNDLYYLEPDWKSIVANADDLPKKVQNQNDAIWELLHTEVFYLRRLKVITDLFLSCLCNLQSECLLNEIDTSRMFSNILEVYSSNHHFWVEHLMPMLNDSRATHQPLNPMLMRDGFLKFDQIFHPYLKYCLEHNTCLQYVKEKHKESGLFKAYVVWCETQKDCERLRLMDLLVKPMQRLTKYSLLLKAILKKTDSEEQKQALRQMNSCVEQFVCIVDSTLRRKNEEEKLTNILSRIESYDAIESNNDEVEKLLKEYTRLDLTCVMPGCANHFIRQLFVEGPMKLKDGQAGKVDVHCFLFTDILLICKPVNKKNSDRVKVIRQPFVIDRIVIQELKEGSGFAAIYLNEYKVASAAFVLYSSDTKIWTEYIKKAQDQYRYIKTMSAEEVTLYRTFDEDEDYEFPTMALLSARSKSSSRSSLVRSHSGSFDTSDPLSSTSNVMIAPASTPNLLQTPYSQQLTPQQQQQSQPMRAVSFELGSLRNPSLTVEDIDSLARSNSVENKITPVSVTITSSRPERRAFLLRSTKSGPGSSGYSTHIPYSNTLSVNVPYQYQPQPQHQPQHQHQHQHIHTKLSSPLTHTTQVDHHHHDNPPASISVPVIHTTSLNFTSNIKNIPPRPPSPRLSRTLPINMCKPPLVKSKHISGILLGSTPPTNESNAPKSDQDTGMEGNSSVDTSGSVMDLNNENLSEEESLKCRLHQKRTCRAERRYHTADSIDHLKSCEKDNSIHKRLSWNYGQQQTQKCHSHSHSFSKDVPSHCERILCNKHFSNKCLSSESVYSSSGFSSTGSVGAWSMGSSECEQCGVDILDHIDESESSSDTQTVTLSEGEDACCSHESVETNALNSSVISESKVEKIHSDLPGSNIKIDISEVKDGISSVQIKVNNLKGDKTSKTDLQRMKEFLLSSLNVEASEV